MVSHTLMDAGYEVETANDGREALTKAQAETELARLAEEDPPAFMCHFYNQYFAHTAGGKMIGKKMSDLLLDGKELEFYKWDGDLQEMMAAVKASINAVAEDWDEAQKQHCLEETEKSFKLSGSILQEIAK